MGTLKSDIEDIFMGFVAVGNCSECGQETFSADGVCAACKTKIAEEDREFFSNHLLDCE